METKAESYLALIMGWAVMLVSGTHFSAQSAEEIVRIMTTEAGGEFVASRVHLKDSDGKVIKPEQHPHWNDHFVMPGEADISLKPGTYSWEIERGPEYKRISGSFTLLPGEKLEISEELKRITDLKAEGWYGGDLHVHRTARDIKLLMMAEDLDYAPVIDWWNKPASGEDRLSEIDYRFDGHRVFTLRAGEDEREGGALLYIGLHRPLDLTVRSREFPSPLYFVDRARTQNPGIWIDIEKPFWWDVPVWIASGKMNSIGIANNHMYRLGMLESEAWGRSRDQDRLPAPRGNGLWSQEIYYHLLDAGIRIPPSAGSASGVLKNPVGHNRVYVHLGNQTLNRKNFFKSLAEGKCFVTNGPLIRVRANSQLPGATFQLTEENQFPIELDIQLSSNDPVSKIQVIHNGIIHTEIPYRGEKISRTIEVRESGWILVRAIADIDSTFRFGSTAPWYIETSGGESRVSRTSAQFFLDWTEMRIERVKKNISDPAQLQSVLTWHLASREFWTRRLMNANAR